MSEQESASHIGKIIRVLKEGDAPPQKNASDPSSLSKAFQMKINFKALILREKDQASCHYLEEENPAR